MSAETCAICDKPLYCRGYCQRHYDQIRWLTTDARERQNKRRNERYAKDFLWREKKLAAERARYANNPELRRKKSERMKRWRARQKALAKADHRRGQKAAAQRKRYANDPGYREMKKKLAREHARHRYATDAEYREDQKRKKRERHARRKAEPAGT